jgi:hypothetical protein
MSDYWDDILRQGQQMADNFQAQCDADAEHNARADKINSLISKLRIARQQRDQAIQQNIVLSKKVAETSKMALDHATHAAERSKQAAESSKQAAESSKTSLVDATRAAEISKLAADSSKMAADNALLALEYSKKAAKYSDLFTNKKCEHIVDRLDYQQMQGLVPYYLHPHLTHLISHQAVLIEALRTVCANSGMSEEDITKMLQATNEVTDSVKNLCSTREMAAALREDLQKWKDSRMPTSDFVAIYKDNKNPEILNDIADKIIVERHGQLNEVLRHHFDSTYRTMDWLSLPVNPMKDGEQQPKGYKKIQAQDVSKLCGSHPRLVHAFNQQEKQSTQKIQELQEENRQLRSDFVTKAREVSGLTRDLAHHMAQSAAFRQQLSSVEPTNPLVTDSHLRQRVAQAAYDQLARSDFKDWAIVKEVGVNTAINEITGLTKSNAG